MNKKFLSAVLFGALMASSTGTFVSCKDYDDCLLYTSTGNWLMLKLSTGSFHNVFR